MSRLIHWFMANASVMSVLVAVGVAVLLICGYKCCDCSHPEKDDLFTRHDS